MSDIAEFLTAHSRADETVQRLLHVHRKDDTYSFSGCVTCDAGDNSCGCMGGGIYDYPCETLRLLALPHAGHPDYDPAWSL